MKNLDNPPLPKKPENEAEAEAGIMGNEIEITPAMLAAGVTAHAQHDEISPRDLVATIYRAMVQALKA